MRSSREAVLAGQAAWREVVRIAVGLGIPMLPPPAPRWLTSMPIARALYPPT